MTRLRRRETLRDAGVVAEKIVAASDLARVENIRRKTGPHRHQPSPSERGRGEVAWLFFVLPAAEAVVGNAGELDGAVAR